MRILHVRSSGGFGGPESGLTRLLPALVGLGHEPILFISARPGKHLSDAAQRYSPARVIQADDHGPVDRRLYRQLRETVAAVQPHILHSHDYKSNLLTLLVSRATGLPAVATVHGYHGRNVDRLRLLIYESLDRLVLRWFPAVIIVGGSYRSLGRGRYEIPNGINGERLASAARHPLPDSPWRHPSALRLLAASRLVPVKGHGVLLHACSLLPPSVLWELCIAGDGPARAQLQRQIRELGLGERVRLLGYRDDVAALMASCHILVHPSYRESLPQAILEALALGKPVIATRVGAATSVVRTGETGWCVPAGSPQALARAIENAWCQRDHLPRMGEAGRDLVVREFSHTVMAQRYAAVYEDVLCG